MVNKVDKINTGANNKLKKRRRRRNAKLVRSKIRKRNNAEYNSTSFYKFLKKTKFSPKKLRVKTNYNNQAIIRLPKNFSLINDPDAAIEVFQILASLQKKEIDGVYFDHSACTNIDIGASTVMDIFTLNLNNYFKRKKDFEITGKYPAYPKVICLLIASGIIKHLKVDNEIREALLDSGIAKTFDMLSGGKHTSTFKVGSRATLTSSDGASVSDLAATHVIDYFNECLDTQGFYLETEGQAYLTNIVGETINNCELHAGDFCQWFASGHYYIEENEECGELHLSIINFGQTIYEGLKNNSKSQKTKDLFTKLSDHHVNRGFFRVNQWDREALWTLYALQDGVSRVKTDEEDGLDRGNGTIDLISAFQAIGGNANGGVPEMSIISGNSYIYFNADPISKLRPMDVNGTKRYQVAFNETNDLQKPPDSKFVKKLKNYFPGTAITMRFFLDRKHIERLKNNAEDIRP